MLAEDLGASKQDRTLSSDETRLLFKAIFWGLLFQSHMYLLALLDREGH